MDPLDRIRACGGGGRTSGRHIHVPKGRFLFSRRIYPAAVALPFVNAERRMGPAPGGMPTFALRTQHDTLLRAQYTRPDGFCQFFQEKWKKFEAQREWGR